MGACGAPVMLLTGSFRRALDDKMRLAIPKPLRDQLPSQAPLYLTPGLDGCLAVYSSATFAALGDRLEACSPAAREVRGYSRLFFSQAAAVPPDAQWRFRVTAALARLAGLSGEVGTLGVRGHSQVWAVEPWEGPDDAERYGGDSGSACVGRCEGPYALDSGAERLHRPVPLNPDDESVAGLAWRNFEQSL